jgi:hypothetical protein
MKTFLVSLCVISTFVASSRGGQLLARFELAKPSAEESAKAMIITFSLDKVVKVETEMGEQKVLRQLSTVESEYLLRRINKVRVYEGDYGEYIRTLQLREEKEGARLLLGTGERVYKIKIHLKSKTIDCVIRDPFVFFVNWEGDPVVDGLREVIESFIVVMERRSLLLE